jgi:3-oxoacyl-[acyl-carrier-protein] synthase III
MRIESISYHLPNTELSNPQLLELFENFDVQKLEQKVGIKSRRIASDDETAADLAYHAGLKVLKEFDKSKIDFLIFCTQSPDYFLPSSSCILQDKLGLSTHIGAFDFNLGCSGFVYGLSLAKGLISSKQAKNVLLLFGETYTKHIHPNDKANRAIFGDAGSACIISDSDEGDIGEFSFGTDGGGANNLIVKNGAFRAKNTNVNTYSYGSGNLTSDAHLYMNGPEVFNYTIEVIPDLIKETLAKNNVSSEDVDYFVFHQANKFMLNYLRKKTGIEKSKFLISMENTGNTVSNTIPIVLSNFEKEGIIKRGNKICIVGFGVGLSQAGTVITF